MELSELRTRINTIDDQLLELFLQRMNLSGQVAAEKRKTGLPVLDRSREREILSRMQAGAGAYEADAYHLFTTLFALSRLHQGTVGGGDTPMAARLQAALNREEALFPQTGLVACQGIEGSNSQRACDRLLPRGSIVYVKSFEAVFDAVSSGLCQFGVVPIENSANGSVRAVYDLLQRKPLHIVRATRLCIRHELLALPGAKLEDITQIYSHPQAIGQCSRFLSEHTGVRVIPWDNTAAAAKLVAQSGNPHAAAIASQACGGLYGLTSLGADIQDSDNNYTRFICLAKDFSVYAGANRISLILSSDNTPGALYHILSRPAALGINMTKLESCPISGRNFEFVFFLELEASLRQPGVAAMLGELQESCQMLQLLGSYGEV